jgi:ArsR family transcriptional regulator, arsenate/arsenite/antimonite-responsive transcriptional repressor
MRPKRGQNGKKWRFPGLERKSKIKMPGGGKTLGRSKDVDILPYFCNHRNMKKPDPLLVTRSADRFSALGAEPRLQILRVLLASHPTGMVAGEIQEELGIPASTLSHHLEKLKQVGLIKMRRESTYLWYSADTEALREVMNFLYEECCTSSRAVPAESVVQISS